MDNVIRKLAGGVFMLVMLTITLTGCGNQKETAKEQQVVEFVANNAKADTIYAKVIEKFEAENPDIKVKLNVVTDQTAMDVRLAQGEYPGVMEIPVLDVKRYASMGILEPLDEKISDEDKKDYGEGVMQTATFEGHIYSLPFYTDDIALYYNKDMVEKAGIQMPGNPDEAWDWDTLVGNAKKVQEVNNTSYALAIGSDISIFMPLLYSNNATVLNADQTAAGINSPEAIETINWLKSWFDEGFAPLEVFLNGSPDMMFLQGEVPFIFYFGGANGILNADNKESDKPINFSATYLPVQKSRGNKLGGWQMALFNGNDEATNEAAYKFASYFLNEVNMADVCQELGVLPTRQSSQQRVDFGELNESANIMMEEIANIPAFCVSDFSLPEYKTYKAILTSGVQSAVVGDLTVEEACAEMEQQINKEVFGK